ATRSRALPVRVSCSPVSPSVPVVRPASLASVSAVRGPRSTRKMRKNGRHIRLFFAFRVCFAGAAPVHRPPYAKAWICGLEGSARALVVPGDHVGGGCADSGSALAPRREHLGPGQGPDP